MAIGCNNISMHGVTISNTNGIGVLLRNVYGNLFLSYLKVYNNHVGLYIDLGNVEQNTRNPVNISIANSSFLFGRALGKPFYYMMAAGVTMRLFQQRINISICLVNVTLLDNEGHNGNFYMEFMRAKPNVTVFIDRLNSTHATGLTENYGFYVQLQASQIDLESLKQIYLTMINSCFKHSCARIYNSGIQNGYNRLHHFVLVNTTIEKSDCMSSLSVDNIAEIRLHSIHINDSQGTIMNVLQKTSVTMVGRCIFHGNSGGLAIQKSNLTFGRDSFIQFTNNTWPSIELFTLPSEGHRAVLFTEGAVLEFLHSVVTFEGNKARFCGGIMAINSTLSIDHGTIEFIRNEGRNGGAMALYDGSIIYYVNIYRVTCNITFVGNHAEEHGGALYVDDVGYANIYSRTNSKSFIKNQDNSVCVFGFKDNSARLGGNAVFGGWIDLVTSPGIYGTNFTFDKRQDDLSVVSSNPIRVCVCENNSITMVPNCNITSLTEQVYPGESFSLSVVTVGQRFGTTSFVVQARFVDKNSAQLHLSSQYAQQVNVNCTSISYTVSSSRDNETLILTVLKPYYVPRDILQEFPLLFEDLMLTIYLEPCPIGFTLDQKLNICTCQSTLIENNICNAKTFRVSRQHPNQWINATFVHRVTKEPGVIVHHHCPHSFCTKEQMLSLDLDNPDVQCAFNRSGTLCGKCQANYSQVFGTENCRHCSSLWVLLFIPLFAIAGLLLVAFVLILNLTVKVGAVNGLIFYANIVRANHSIFFTPETNNTFPSWFIAWINLDFGIEACFYDGMDAYAKTWLQFLFPLYIWFIVLTIILLSRRFDTVAKLCGNNAVPVLATLFLLSYAKLLQIIITAFQQTRLHYPDGNYTRVWLKDGNVDYLKGKHIPLFIAALLLLLFISLPYTAILLTIQWLQKWSEYRVLFWVNRLKPLFDAYTGPYKDNHRYWTGLLLLIRVILFLVFSLNVLNNPSMNLIAICIIIILMCVYLSFIGGVYKSRVNNLIELSFILNLGVLSVVTFYHIYTNKSLRGVTNASVSISLITFIMIILKEIFYRCFLKSNPNAHKLQTRPKNINELKLFIEALIPAQTEKDSSDNQNMDDDSSAMVDRDRTTGHRRDDENTQCTTTTVQVQLREPLLDHSASEEEEYPTY